MLRKSWEYKGYWEVRAIKEKGKKQNRAGRAVRWSSLTKSASPRRGLSQRLPFGGVLHWRGMFPSLHHHLVQSLAGDLPPHPTPRRVWPWLEKLRQIIKELTAGGYWTITLPCSWSFFEEGSEWHMSVCPEGEEWKNLTDILEKY